jgi:hypothetical protein
VISLLAIVAKELVSSIVFNSLLSHTPEVNVPPSVPCDLVSVIIAQSIIISDHTIQ